MIEDLDIEALGATVRIVLPETPHSSPSEGGEKLSEAVRRVWSQAASTGTGSEPAAAVAPSSAGRAAALEELSQRVTLTAIEARRGRLWMVHAAGLAAADGRVVMLVGRSGSGKTTAARTLSRSMHYVTDETVGITADGEILPYRKPLSVIVDPSAPKAQLAPPAQVARPDRPLRLGAVVILDRRAELDTEPSATALAESEAIELLAAQTSYLSELPRPLETITTLLRRASGAHRVTYREATELPSLIEKLLACHDESAGGRTGTATGAPDLGCVSDAAPDPAGSRSATGTDAHRAATYGRAPHRDAVALDGGAHLAVLLERGTRPDAPDLHVLGGIAPAAWRAASRADAATITKAVVSEHGEPAPEHGDGRGPVAAVLERLVRAGVLVATETRWRVSPDVAWTDHDDHVALLPLVHPEPRVQHLSGTAAALWRAVATFPTSIESLVFEVHGDSPDSDLLTIMNDTEVFFGELIRMGTLRGEPYDRSGSALGDP
ncbi:ATP-binding protein [Microbacterium sp. 18062]|uniref:ATP-binding protein n=1 Tax=Microbacterium sp. 18062 TaxID=2681410 RepID=UPI00135A6186|nr:ATP-binding protein [Microbacterium sp. 18062]